MHHQSISTQQPEFRIPLIRYAILLEKIRKRTNQQEFGTSNYSNRSFTSYSRHKATVRACYSGEQMSVPASLINITLCWTLSW